MGPSARLNEDFRQTCSIIFGREIGGLEEFAPYLSEMMMSDLSIKSSLSQKKVMLSSPFYREDATIVSQEELGRQALCGRRVPHL